MVQLPVAFYQYMARTCNLIINFSHQFITVSYCLHIANMLNDLITKYAGLKSNVMCRVYGIPDTCCDTVSAKLPKPILIHYCEVIMGAIASQITSLLVIQIFLSSIWFDVQFRSLAPFHICQLRKHKRYISLNFSLYTYGRESQETSK